MSMYSEFIHDFAERTLANLELIQQEQKENQRFEATQLINSLLGMLVFIQEKELQEKQWDKNIAQYQSFQNQELKINWIDETRKDKDIERFGEPDSMKAVIYHMRNAIAHCGIEPISCEEPNSNEISGFIFRDSLHSRNDEREREPYWELELRLGTIEQIARDLIEYIKES